MDLRACLKNGRWCLEVMAAISLMCLLPATIYADSWSTGYYPGWEQSGMPASNIDFATFTHVIHFSVVPNANGTLNYQGNGITPANSTDVVTRAHAAGRKVLICVGGASTEPSFQTATAAGVLPVFINNLTNFMATNGYDGVDVDWEPLTAADAPLYTNLIQGLRSALNGFASHKLLTAAVGAYSPYGDPPASEYTLFATLQSQFDQLNIMTYDLSGPYEGWVTWFNSPVYDGGYRFPSSGGLVPSVDGAVSGFITNGVAPAKLGIGIAFYGYTWTGTNITLPRQSWTTAPTAAQINYTTIMATYYQSNRYHWDDSAQSAYLSITNVNPGKDIFLSYDDQRTCQALVSYTRNRGLGGVMVWELAQDYQSGQPGQLAQALKQSLTTPGLASLKRTSDDMNLTFNSIALGSYRVQWTTDLAMGSWNTLMITNNSGSGGPLEITDSGAVTNQPVRFYRVRTPP